MNIAALTGRLTAEPELKKTPSGASVTTFTIAVDRKMQKQEEDRKVDFLNCIAWRNTAEFICNYFRKGQTIAIQGEIQTDTYEKDGIKRKKWEIVVENASFCGPKPESNNQRPADSQTDNSSEDAFEPMNFAEDDDLPF